jgi:hypothetical protein
VYLLTLDKHAPLDASGLAQLQARSAHVTVEFSGEPNLRSGVAHLVQEDGP